MDFTAYMRVVWTTPWIGESLVKRQATLYDLCALPAKLNSVLHKLQRRCAAAYVWHLAKLKFKFLRHAPAAPHPPKRGWLKCATPFVSVIKSNTAALLTSKLCGCMGVCVFVCVWRIWGYGQGYWAFIWGAQSLGAFVAFGLGITLSAFWSFHIYFTCPAPWQISGNLCNCMHFVLMRFRVTSSTWATPQAAHVDIYICIYIFTSRIYCGNFSRAPQMQMQTLRDRRCLH